MNNTWTNKPPFVIPLKSGIQRAASAARMTHMRRGHGALDTGFRRYDAKGKSLP
jgi:hypothetical protein